MKKLLITLILTLVFTSFAYAEPTFYNVREATLAWDLVTTDTDEDTVDGVRYKLYLVNAVTDPDKANPVEVSDTLTNYTVITLSKGRFYVGVQAYLDDLSSVINWADEIENQGDSELFGLRFAVPPKGPKYLKRGR